MLYNYQINKKDSTDKRYRDTMEQERVAISDLGSIIGKQISFKDLFGKL